MEQDKKRLQNERSSLGTKLEAHKQHVISISQKVTNLDESIQASALLKKKVKIISPYAELSSRYVHVL